MRLTQEPEGREQRHKITVFLYWTGTTQINTVTQRNRVRNTQPKPIGPGLKNSFEVIFRWDRIRLGRVGSCLRSGETTGLWENSVSLWKLIFCFVHQLIEEHGLWSSQSPGPFCKRLPGKKRQKPPPTKSVRVLWDLHYQGRIYMRWFPPDENTACWTRWVLKILSCDEEIPFILKDERLSLFEQDVIIAEKQHDLQRPKTCGLQWNLNGTVSKRKCGSFKTDKCILFRPEFNDVTN